ncbi:hypothetical protein CCHR01_17217 [Colletotrichum chrysophilum]|uniref:Uncharacterized protein n=1 Tax=Colletotrichum chrysophilum TaxID=1836956 RepID=A0AAD9E9R8_9PEZI|nr:hypothetical protein CCHR01_17217 [Colletotrichum chrysophilum]
MKSFSFTIAFSILSTASANDLFQRGLDCKGSGNNCQHSVGGTAGLKPPPSSRLADCSLLNRVIVIPSPVTDIATETVTFGTMFIPPFLPGGDKRSVEVEPTLNGGAVTVSPSGLPTYATYCPDAAKYFIACGCAGSRR